MREIEKCFEERQKNIAPFPLPFMVILFEPFHLLESAPIDCEGDMVSFTISIN